MTGFVRTAGGIERIDAVAARRIVERAPRPAILVHESTVEECSSLGGSHAFFTIAGGAAVAHFGGHGCELAGAFEPGSVWLAAVEPLATPESVKNEAWCVPDRVFDARAIALVSVASVEEATRLLAALSPSRA
jgi:hypothetical protein